MFVGYMAPTPIAYILRREMVDRGLLNGAYTRRTARTPRKKRKLIWVGGCGVFAHLLSARTELYLALSNNSSRTHMHNLLNIQIILNIHI